jgi:Uma2 family endonuclease
MPMATAEATRRYTHDDLLEMPEGDGKRYEIIDGELFVSAAPFRPHQGAVGNLYLILQTYARQHGLGRMWLAPFDVIFSKTDVVEPDLLFVRAERSGIVQDWVRGVPDLAIEVLSPSSHRHDEVRKRALYERYGVPEYWIVHPDAETVKIYRLEGERYGRPELLDARAGDVVRSALFPGLELPVAEIFVD